MSLFVVRDIPKEEFKRKPLYLGYMSKYCNNPSVRTARIFNSVEEAKLELLGVSTFREVCRLQYKLVWFSGGKRAKDPCPVSDDRFDTIEKAYASHIRAAYVGCYGVDDTTGWKVIPVLRRVRK